MENRYSIERVPGASEDKSGYGFKYLWDVESIEQAIINAHEKSDIPCFYLSKIEIHPASKCNLSCDHCYGKLLARGGADLSKGDIEKLFLDIRKNMPNEDPLIIYSGLYSDPLTNREIREIIDLTGKYHFRFAIYTNGLLMDDELIDSLLQASLRSNGVKPSYLAFNITGACNAKKFDLQFSIIKKLLYKRREFGAEDKLQINAPILGVSELKNYSFLSKIITRLSHMGVDNIRLSLPWPCHSINGADESYISEKESAKLIHIFERIKRKFPNKIRIRYPQKQGKFSCCYAMMMSLSINSIGDVFPCPETSSSLLKNKFSYGNIKKNKISAIWHGKKHKQLITRINHDKDKCSCCPVHEEFNELCNKFYFPR